MSSRLALALALVVAGSLIVFVFSMMLNDRADAAHPLPMFDAAPPEPMPSDGPTAHRHVDEECEGHRRRRRSHGRPDRLRHQERDSYYFADEAKVTVVLSTTAS